MVVPKSQVFGQFFFVVDSGVKKGAGDWVCRHDDGEELLGGFGRPKREGEHTQEFIYTLRQQ